MMNKKIKIKSAWVPIFFLLLVTIFTITYSPIKAIPLEAERGEIDLGHLDLDDQTIAKLGGEWQFYDHVMIQDLEKVKSIEYVQVPYLFEKNAQQHNQPYGVATYKVQIKGLQPDTYYGVQIINEVSAYRLTVNGTDIIKSGKVGYSKDTHQPEMKGRVGYFKPDRKGNAEVLLEISNFSYNHGGFWQVIRIGHQETITKSMIHQTDVEILFSAMILSFGLFFLALFFVNKEQTSLLYFSIISLLIALRIMLTNNKQFYDFISNISWDTGTRLEFLTGYLLLPCFTLFVLSLGYIKKTKFIHGALYLFILASCIITLFTQNEVYANLLGLYKLICIMSAPFFIYVMIQGIRRKKSGSLYVLIGTLGLVVSVLIDFYANLNYYILSFGTFFMLVLFSIVVINDFFILKQQHDYLEDAIMKDPLTGMKNRFYLNLLIDNGLPFADTNKYYIFFFDLNKFKFINDHYGHNIGDAILVESARRIERYFSAPSDIVCRYGGDEFIAITLSNEEPSSIKKRAEKIIASFKEPFIYNGHHYSLSVSIGISDYSKGDVLEKVINESDEAMYEAKKQNAEGIVMASQTREP